MKKHKLHILFTTLSVMLCVMLSPIASIKANASYEIVFKAGLHGTINNTDRMSYCLDAGTVFPDEPNVEAEAGYVFKGWNKELPDVGSAVQGKCVYVAQYDILVSGLNYIVRYVNEDNAQIATPKASMAEEGSTVNERAKTIPGYAYVTGTKSAKIDKENVIITFEYTLTNPEEVIRYEEEVVNQTQPNGNNNANNNVNNNQGQNQQPGNNANEDPANNGNTQPETEVVPDPEAPLARGDGKKDNSMLPYAIAAGCLGLVIVGGIVLYARKKRKETVK